MKTEYLRLELHLHHFSKWKCDGDYHSRKCRQNGNSIWRISISSEKVKRLEFLILFNFNLTLKFLRSLLKPGSSKVSRLAARFRSPYVQHLYFALLYCFCPFYFVVSGIPKCYFMFWLFFCLKCFHLFDLSSTAPEISVFTGVPHTPCSAYRARSTVERIITISPYLSGCGFYFLSSGSRVWKQISWLQFPP